MLYLFTTPSCPNCPRAKELLKSKNVDVLCIDASQVEGLQMAKRYECSSVPSLIQVDAEGGKTDAFYGIEEIETYIDGLCSLPDFKN